MAALPAVHTARRSGDVWLLTVDQVHVAVPALLELLKASGATLQRLTTRRASLEDVFVTLTEEAAAARGEAPSSSKLTAVMPATVGA
jgi:uncharacterized protein YqhQ